MRGRHRCVQQAITEQVNMICTSDVDSSTDFAAAPNGGLGACAGGALGEVQ